MKLIDSIKNYFKNIHFHKWDEGTAKFIFEGTGTYVDNKEIKQKYVYYVFKCEKCEKRSVTSMSKTIH